MTELIKKINKRIDELKIREIPSDYKRAIEIFKIESNKSFRKVEVGFLPIYTLLLITKEVGIDKFSDVLYYINCMQDLFIRKAFDDSFYEEYYADLELLQEQDEKSLEANNNTREIFRRIRNKSYALSEEVFFDCQADKPIKAIITLFKLCPKKEVYLEFLKFHEIDHIYHSISTMPETAMMLEIMSEKELDKMQDDFIKKEASYLTNAIYDNYKKIKEFDKNLISDTRQHNKQVNKISNNYKKLMGSISYQQNHYISNIDNDLKLIEDDDLDILELYLKFAIQNNQDYDEKIEKENKKLKANQISNLEIMFNKYNFSFSRLDKNTQVKISQIDDIESRLKIIDKSKLSLNDYSASAIYNIISLQLDNMNFILNLYKREIIDTDFIEKNIKLLKNDNIFNNFKNNIELLSNINIAKIARYNQNIFLIDNKKIMKRYKLFIEDYKIPTEKIYNFEFLTDDRVFDLIDNFIELGYIEQIRNNPNYLTLKNELMIKRLYVASLIDLKVINEDKSFIGSIVSGKDFYVSDNRLDEFILDEKDDYIDNSALDGLERLEIKPDRLLYKLKEYEVGDDYQINGVLLSKRRILRNLEAFLKVDCKDVLFDAIIYKATSLTSDTIEVISKICSHKVKTK